MLYKRFSDKSFTDLLLQKKENLFIFILDKIWKGYNNLFIMHIKIKINTLLL